MTEEGRPFEELQRELEEIVGRLERGDVAVDEAIRLWQRGEELLRVCAAMLDEADGAVERLSGDELRARDTETTEL